MLAAIVLTYHAFGFGEFCVVAGGLQRFLARRTHGYAGPYVAASASAAAFLIVAIFMPRPFVLCLYSAGLVACGTAIGLWIRNSEGLRRLWLPFGLVLAIAIGGVIFASGHYGNTSCLPRS
jgi:hypothetical protein